MTCSEIVKDVLQVLNLNKIPYMIGRVAGQQPVQHRTIDERRRHCGASFFVGQRNCDCEQIALPEGNPQFGFESVTATKKLLLTSEAHDFIIDLFELSDDEHDQARFARRKELNLFEIQAWVATAEDMIVSKLRWADQLARTKDVDDAKNTLAVQGDKLDFPYIESWCDKHGTRTLLDKLRADVADI